MAPDGYDIIKDDEDGQIIDIHGGPLLVNRPGTKIERQEDGSFLVQQQMPLQCKNFNIDLMGKSETINIDLEVDQ